MDNFNMLDMIYSLVSEYGEKAVLYGIERVKVRFDPDTVEKVNAWANAHIGEPNALNAWSLEPSVKRGADYQLYTELLNAFTNDAEDASNARDALVSDLKIMGLEPADALSDMANAFFDSSVALAFSNYWKKYLEDNEN